MHLRGFMGLIFMAMLSSNALASFKITNLAPNQIAEMKKRNVLSVDCPVKTERLKLLTVSYYDFEQKVHHDGEIVVLDAAAPHVLKIFKELYKNKFPLAKVKLMEHYEGQDEEAMNDNNSSCFNDRASTSDSTRKSIHAYGLAIDINPIQNPFLEMNLEDGSAQFKPKEGVNYANRLIDRPGKDMRPGMSEQIKDIFIKHGFPVWGGNWDEPIDYQHFQVSRSMAELLSVMPSEEATRFFDDHVQNPDLLKNLQNIYGEKASLAEEYSKKADVFAVNWTKAKNS